MAKTATDTSIGPNAYGVGLGIFDDGVQTLIEAMNYVVCEATTTYFAFNCNPTTVMTHDGNDDFSFIRRVRYQGQIRVDPDVQEIRFAAECIVGSLGDVAVYFTLAGEVITLTFDTPSSTYELEDTVLTADTGTGLLSWTIETELIGASEVGTDLIQVTCEGVRILAADLPDPAP